MVEISENCHSLSCKPKDLCMECYYYYLFIRGSESLPLPLSPTSTEHRLSSRPSMQLTNLNDCCSSYRGDTPLSSASDYKHHMLSSSVNEATTPIYDRLSDYNRKESVSGEEEKVCGSDGAQQIPMEKERVTINLYASEGRIDSVANDSMAAGNNLLSSRARANSAMASVSVGKIQSKSSNSLFMQQQQQQLLSVSQCRQQQLPTSLNQLHVVSASGYNQHWLCPPKNMAGSTPVVSNCIIMNSLIINLFLVQINCRSSCDSMLENYRPTNYMTDV